MTEMPPEYQPLDYAGQQPMRPHRGTAVLVLGILGLAVCPICGIIAWVMGNNDLREMEAGRMDPSGMGLTKAGKICGMISVIWVLFWIVIWVVFVVGAAASGY